MAKRKLDIDAIDRAAETASAKINVFAPEKTGGKTPGRPKKEIKRDARIQVMLTQLEYERFVEARNKMGVDLDGVFARMLILKGLDS
ncbi:MAG: hypothetical protein AB7E49_03355 [Campylobacterales bacterium]